jgi:phospholipid/cholesterol/gamma-HCH transport system substrate-binding protein
MTILALLILMVSLLFVNNFRFGPAGHVYTASFKFLGDLKSDSPIKYAGGIDVGRVKDIRFYNGMAAVDMLITQPGFKLRKDSQVAIYSTSLLGTKYVQVMSDLGTGEELKTGEVLEGKDSNNLDKTFSQLGDVLETFETMMGDPKAKENFIHSIDNLNKTTDTLYQLVTDSRSKIEKIISDVSASSGDASELVTNMKKVSRSLNSLTQAMDKKDVKATMDNLNSTLKNMNQLTQDIHDGKGAIGVLMQDPKVGDDVKKLVEELKAHPWKLLWKN